jgi:hypothetical protein
LGKLRRTHNRSVMANQHRFSRGGRPRVPLNRRVRAYDLLPNLAELLWGQAPGFSWGATETCVHANYRLAAKAEVRPPKPLRHQSFHTPSRPSLIGYQDDHERTAPFSIYWPILLAGCLLRTARTGSPSCLVGRSSPLSTSFHAGGNVQRRDLARPLDLMLPRHQLPGCAGLAGPESRQLGVEGRAGGLLVRPRRPLASVRASCSSLIPAVRRLRPSTNRSSSRVSS